MAEYGRIHTDGSRSGGQPMLLPCPFCGGVRIEAFHHIDRGWGASWHVQCVAKECGNSTYHHDTEAAAIAVWNTRQPTQSNIFDAGDVQKHTLIVDQDYSSHTVKVKSLDDSQPIQSDAVQADIDAMESILWVDTIIDDKVAIAKAFARHRQYGYDQGYYDGQRDRQLTQDNALRDALEAAPIINLWESKEDFRRRQDGWLKTKYRAALEQSK